MSVNRALAVRLPGRLARVAALVTGLAVLGLAGCSGSSGSTAGSRSTSAATTKPAGRTVPPVPAADLPVSHPTVWLCRPGMTANPCDGGLDATVVTSTLTKSTERFQPAADAPIDCFYVYPTTSQATTANAPARPEQAVIRTTRAQAARFAQVCKLYVPIYRQITLQGITKPGTVTGESVKIATDDVVSAWHDYLAHYNNGRGVVLIGHSQGAGQLKSLITKEIDKNPAERARLVSALLLGGNVQVATGKDAGGDFTNVPACRRTDQLGCVVAYSTFGRVPPKDSLFGRVTANPVLGGSSDPAHQQILCVNPAALTGGRAELHPYLPTRTLGGSFLPATPANVLPDLPTGFVSTPGQVHAECRSQDGATWLQIDDKPGPGDKRSPLPNSLPASWGLHLQDVNVALGDLVDLVGKQSTAWTH